jgi:hypothetical protein
MWLLSAVEKCMRFFPVSHLFESGYIGCIALLLTKTLCRWMNLGGNGTGRVLNGSNCPQFSSMGRAADCMPEPI